MNETSDETKNIAQDRGAFDFQSEGMNPYPGDAKRDRNQKVIPKYGSIAFRAAPFPRQVRFNTPNQASLILPCELDFLNSYYDFDAECSKHSKGWAIYDWTLKEEKLFMLKILRRNLPEGIVMSPIQDEVFAWLDKGNICIGKPYDNEHIKCVPLPAN